MRKRILSTMLAVVLVVGILLSAVPGAAAQTTTARPAFTGKLSAITPQRVEDTFAYLDEVYVKNYPEAALEMNQADMDDRQVLLTLAQTITAGCTTDRQKADAVAQWIQRNITYDPSASAYPNDTFYTRRGNCLSYGMLMQSLLRLLKVPAVVGDGWRGDMANSTTALFNGMGHAWCFVRLNGEWVLYDPLWLQDSTTDRDYMAKNFYMDTVEFITPASDRTNLPPALSEGSTKVYYTDGIWYIYSTDMPTGTGTLTAYFNNLELVFMSNQSDGDSYSATYYLDREVDTSTMRRGQVYCNGWLGGFGKTYAHVNGMIQTGTVMEYQGTPYLINGIGSFPILADENDYSIRYGTFSLPLGYTGPFLGIPREMDGYYYVWSSKDEDVATINSDGTITTHDTGNVLLRADEYETRTGDWCGATSVYLYVSDEERVPDYTDRIPDSGDENPPPDDPDTDPVDPPDDPDTNPVDPPDDPPADPEPSFTDVVPGAFYEDAVNWAVENGVTNGTSATTFAPSNICTRAQVVTFLHRAAGEPAPSSGFGSVFMDVEAGKFYSVAVLWALENGITNGLDEYTFGTSQSCTRAQVVTFLWRTAGKPTPNTKTCPFADVKTNGYYYQAVLWAVENGITNGMDADTFGTDGICTRGQIVTFLHRYVQQS